MKAENVALLTEEFEKVGHEWLSDDDLIPTIEIDAELKLADLTKNAVNQIKALSPFGTGNPEPLFYTHSLGVVSSRIVGEGHLKLRLREGKKSMEAIGFRQAEKQPLEGQRVHAVYTPEINYWQGNETLQLKIADLEVMNEHSGPLRPHEIQ